jgi:hypothetical protein
LPLLLLLLVMGTCGCEDDSDSDDDGGSVVLTHVPLALASVRTIIPLGNLNPPGHTLPTSHIYFYLEGDARVEMWAVAAGRIRTVYYNEWSDDYRVEIEHTSTFMTMYDHVEDVPAGLEVGTAVEAGDLLGYGNPRTGAVDLGVVDYQSERSFITPARYHEFDRHCADPFSAFTPDLREALLALNPRTIEPRGGKINYDVAGTLAGNWFLESLPVEGSSGHTFAYGQLAFVYDNVNPVLVRVSCGGTLATAPFSRGVTGNTPDPASVTPASGLVKYALSSPTPSVLLVQMMSEGTLRAEVFADAAPEDIAGFTASAQNYIR